MPQRWELIRMKKGKNMSEREKQGYYLQLISSTIMQNAYDVQFNTLFLDAYASAECFSKLIHIIAAESSNRNSIAGKEYGKHEGKKI